MVPTNFNQLYYFWVITKSGSVTAATRHLLLNQSTLSGQLKQFEKSLGRQLLTRSRHGVSLTDDGRTVFEYCERIFTQAEEMLALMRSGGVSRPCCLRLGVSKSIARHKVLAITRRINSLDKTILVKVSSGLPDDLEEKLRRRTVDIVLSDVDISAALGSDHRARLVASAPHFFVAVPAYKRKGKKLLALLAEAPLMLRPPENAIRKDVDYFLHRNDVIPNIHAEVDDPDLILTMALRGEGIGVLDPFVIRKYLDSGRLVKLHERPLGIRENLWLVCSRHPHSNPRIQTVLTDLWEDFRFDWESMRETTET